MSTGSHDVDSAEEHGANPGEAAEAETHDSPEGEKPKPKLDMNVEITDSGPCRKHVKVSIARAEVDRQFKESLGSIRKEAAVPGFRIGRAPRQLVEKRFKKEVAGQVKSTLLMASLEQIDEDYKLHPISQPDFDAEAIELPENGPMNFEMDVEVQPDFALPHYQGLKAKRVVRELKDADVDAQLKQFLERYAQIVPKLDAPAAVGDYVTADLVFHRDGQTLNEAKEVQFRLQPELRFQDGHVPNLAEALVGVKPGERREATAQVGSASPDPALRNQQIGVTFVVHDLKQLRLPEVDAEFLDRIGFQDEPELRTALREVLERRYVYQQRQSIREQLLDQLIGQAPFDLPRDLVARQEKTSLRKQVLDMREAGMTDSEIRAREAQIKANVHESTLRSLKEFFLLSKIADAENLKVEDDDLENEIDAMAARSDESPRRIRARVEKEGLAESIAAQVLERKTIDRLIELAEFEDVAHQAEDRAVETLDQSASPATAEGEGDAHEHEPEAHAHEGEANAEGDAPPHAEGQGEGEAKADPAV